MMATARALTHLEQLESESIHIMREVVAEMERSVMLYSVGKDSAVMLHLARKAVQMAISSSISPGFKAACVASLHSESRCEPGLSADQVRMFASASASVVAGASP